MKGTSRHQLRNRLPKGYFADCQLSNFEARPTASSDTSQQSNALTTADTHAAASLSSPQWGNCVVGVHGAGGGERSHASGNQFNLSTEGSTMVAGSTAPVIGGDTGTGNGPNQHNSTAGGVKTSGASSLSARHREIIASLAAQGVAIVDDMQRNAARVISGRQS